eukprot:m.147074 g.147074  ORF g.147074 m.147074 type:complete len:223 (+) comp52722_c0_seq7:180-848(+)
MSLRAAFLQLGLGPCYHMEEVFDHATSHGKFWLDAFAHRDVDFKKFLSGYGSGCDCPIAMFYSQLATEFPDAKFVLTVRDPDSWVKSVHSTIYVLSMDWSMRVVSTFVPFMNTFRDVTMRCFDQLQCDLTDHKAMVKAFAAHNASVKACIPADRLLVFEAKEGWGPLCRFLGVAEPTTPFPHINDSAVFQGYVWKMRAAATAILIAILVLGYFLISLSFGRV